MYTEPDDQNHGVYEVRSRRTRLFGDQLERADGGGWQIADRYTMANSAARCVAVRNFRVRFAVEPQLVPELALLETGAVRHGGARGGTLALKVVPSGGLRVKSLKRLRVSKQLKVLKYFPRYYVTCRGSLHREKT